MRLLVNFIYIVVFFISSYFIINNFTIVGLINFLILIYSILNTISFYNEELRDKFYKKGLLISSSIHFIISIISIYGLFINTYYSIILSIIIILIIVYFIQPLKIKKSYLLVRAENYILNFKDIEFFINDIKMSKDEENKLIVNWKRFKLFLVLLNLNEAKKQKNYVQNIDLLIEEINFKFKDLYDFELNQIFNLVKEKISEGDYIEGLILFFTELFGGKENKEAKSNALLLVSIISENTDNIFIYNQMLSRKLFFDKLKGAIIYND